ncbi:Cytochrome c oxidase subunit 2 precursor [Pirellulimonas nuda]|uniref:Cytochrome c oxidase subunit 2 n=1 Tax=Pirellulimonas nuda TaxID=2528009 RepID=A0A518DJG2_9BACT|nr:cytochrome c oxidase subunit II [Pirellulimonas nuda]QDU91624.1 Cytochrome c oxidase subunit 2 precursor [Pirellulimonas nuda]
MTTAHLPPLASFWFFNSGSTFVPTVDSLFYFILWLSTFFFVLIVGLMLFFMVWYRHRPGHAPEHSPHHNNLLEATWTIIPVMLVFVIFGLGFSGFMELRTVPDNAFEVQVIAQKWNWSFQYPNGGIAPELHVPKGRPIKLVLQSKDVLHSIFVPAFRMKMDCVPGRYNTCWFEATEATGSDPGDGFELFCAEYCGTSHSTMVSRVVVYDNDADFQKFLEGVIDPRKENNPVIAGQTLYQNRGCVQCHSLDGAARTGPSFKGGWGKEQKMKTGGPVLMDENYIRESILNPMAKVHDGFNPVMPSYQGQLKDDEIYALIAFIKSINIEGFETQWPAIEGEEGAEAEEGAAEQNGAEQEPEAGEAGEKADANEASQGAEGAEPSKAPSSESPETTDDTPVESSGDGA